MTQSKLAKFLDLTDEQLEESGIDEDLIQEDTGNSGDMVYSYYFNVPEETSKEVLDEKQWKVGERIEIPLWFFEEEDGPDDDGWESLPDFDPEEAQRKRERSDKEIEADIKRREEP